MKEIVNSLDGVLIKPGRRVGNTTRIVDNSIQLLFSGKRVQVVDHVHNIGVDKYLLDQILRTLELIHGLDKNHVKTKRQSFPNERLYFVVDLLIIDGKGNYV